MLKRIICTFLLVFLGFGISLNGSAADRFQWIHSTDTTTFKIDSLRFIITNDERWVYFDSWIISDYNDQGAANWTNIRKENNMTTKGYENLDCTLKHTIYAISKDYRIMSKDLYYADYAFDGSVLDSWTFRDSKFIDTVPKSIGETVALATVKVAIENNITATPK